MYRTNNRMLYFMLSYWCLCICLIPFTTTGCAGRQLTPDQTYKWSMDVYTFHYYLYLDQVASEDYTFDELQKIKQDPTLIKNMEVRTVSEEQKRILDAKWEILQDMDEALGIIREFRNLGKAPPQDQMNRIVSLGDKIIALAGGE